VRRKIGRRRQRVPPRSSPHLPPSLSYFRDPIRPATLVRMQRTVVRTVASRSRVARGLAAALAAGVVSLSSVWAARAAPAEAATSSGPCDSLTDYLRAEMAGPEPIIDRPSLIEPTYEVQERRLEDSLRSPSPTGPMAYARRVTPACRAEARQYAPAAAESLEAARAWTQRPELGWVGRGRIIRCSMPDPAAYSHLNDWLNDPYLPEARAVCWSALSTWPDAERVRGQVFASAVRRNRGSMPDWKVDEAIVAAANVLGTPELREQLVPALLAAHAHRALGYDRLRDALCTDDGMMSSVREQACSSLPAGAEHRWHGRLQPWQWLMRGGVTAAYGALLAGTYVNRNETGARQVATWSGVLGGAMVAQDVLFSTTAFRRTQDDSFVFGVKLLGSTLAGAVIGGVTFYALGHWPAARAPLTAVGLARPYVAAVRFTFD